MFSRVGLTTLGNRLVGNLETPSNGPIIQLVRWRKRRWAPKNASKFYYVRKPTPEDPEEKLELADRYRKYKTTSKALREYFKEEVLAKEAAKSSKVLSDKEEAEWAKLIQVNAEWNKNTAQIREVRQAKEERLLEEKRLADLAEIEEKKLAQLMQAQQLVQEEIKQSKYFIDPNNLDAEIEKALNMRVSYNYAIDKDGNRYVELADGSTVAETKEAETVRRFEQPQDENSKQLENQ